MNPDLLKAARSMKLQGMSDEAIKDHLSSQYSPADIDSCLNSLKDMGLPRTTEGAAGSETSDLAAIGYDFHAKYIFLIGLVVAVLVLLLVVPGIYRYLKMPYVDKLAATLSAHYDVDKSYNAGSTIDCEKQGPTRFGDVTGISVCSLITAKIYYPRVKPEVQVDKSYVDDNGKQVAKPITEKVFDIEYVDKQGKSLDQYIQTGAPIEQFNGANPYYVDAELHLSGFNHVVFSAIQPHASRSGPTSLVNNWGWQSEPSWLGEDSPGENLQKKIDKKIQSDQSPVKGAPTTTEALKKGTAPLVVYYITGYCHQPNIPVLDNFCIIPNLGSYKS